MNRVWLSTVQGPCGDGCLSKKLKAVEEAAHAIHAVSARNIVERRAVTRYHASRDRILWKTTMRFTRASSSCVILRVRRLCR